jgi:hypothetical protein
MPGGGRASDPSLPGILHRLMFAGRQWVAAEVAQSRADARLVVRRIITSAILGLAGFAFLVAGLMLMLEALAIAVGTWLGSDPGGHAVTGGACLILAAIAALVARQMLKFGPHLHSRLTQWLRRNVQPPRRH